LEENVNALKVTLSPEDLSEIERIWPQGAAAGPRYSEAQQRLVNG
jgi:aryl-alcohol dehydrogenase-like predicted oxidoreductase